MNLQQVREQFVRQTGRYDLITDALTFAVDNGADFYIKAGQRMLDRMLEFPKDEGELTFTLATSAISKTIQNVLSVRSVVSVDSSDSTIKYLTRKSMKEIRELYGDEVGNLANVTAAEPTVWSLGWLRTNVGSVSATIEGSGKQLILMPPADRSYTIRLAGLFGSAALSANSSVSFWTVEHPDILVWASMYKLEVGYRNFEGSRTLLENIVEMVQDIDDVVVEQGLVERDQLKDSHRFIQEPIRQFDRYI